jgi:hypothetical protein
MRLILLKNAFFINNESIFCIKFGCTFFLFIFLKNYAYAILSTVMEKVFKFLIFVPITIIFIPAFLIVTHLQKFWSKQLEELFGL